MTKWAVISATFVVPDDFEWDGANVVEDVEDFLTQKFDKECWNTELEYRPDFPEADDSDWDWYRPDGTHATEEDHIPECKMITMGGKVSDTFTDNSLDDDICVFCGTNLFIQTEEQDAIERMVISSATDENFATMIRDRADAARRGDLPPTEG